MDYFNSFFFFVSRVSFAEMKVLKHSKVVVNAENSGKDTPFYIACQEVHKEVVSLLLADMRIDVNMSATDQCTPLWVASRFGHLRVVQLILASGREVDTKIKSIAGPDAWNNKTAAEMARYQATRATLSTRA